MRTTKMIAIGVMILLMTGITIGQELESPEVANRTMRPVVRGQHFAVASMKAEATRAAERILEKGGNAFDAIVAGQAVLGLVDGAMNGIGSDATLLVYDAKAKKVYSINAEGTAPKLATIEWYKEHNGGKLPVNDSLLSGTVPGCIDAWYILLDRWGTMNFAQVLSEAIDLAENGFPVGDSFARAAATTQKIRKYPTSAKVYLPNGRAPLAGEIFRNPDLARTLRRLVEAETQNKGKGRHEALKAARDCFYKGDIAREMARFSEENGGLFRYEDFANYTAKIEEPVSIDYRGYQIYKNASATQGPAELFALRILEGYDLKAMGHNSADYIHTSVEATKLAMADREKYLGDMDFIKIPYTGLLSKEYAAERRAMIDKNTASLAFRPGMAEKFTSDATPLYRPVRITTSDFADHDGDTSYIAVIDSARNMISFTPSLHSAFGTGVVMGNLGFIFNCRGDYYTLEPGEANALAPGKRPRSTLQSTLVMKDGQPHMVLGTPGADQQVLLTMQTLLNMIEFGMNVQQAIESPKWLTRAFPASPFPHTMYPGDLSVEARIPEDVRKQLLARGHKLRVTGAWSDGSLAAIVIDPKTGVLNAGTDPRTEAYAWAW
ncbi:MAG: gamma-glutamyltransferase [Acidobacteria bacterium]|nr:MAG: gamma-glutamyltransferase [Acidobacteriota bacterium]